MKTSVTTTGLFKLLLRSIKIFFFALLAPLALAQHYHIYFTPSPSASSNYVAAYVGVYESTNTAYTNLWSPFGSVAAGGVTNIAIPLWLPSPCYMAVESESTNGLLSAPTNIVLYNTNALATNFPSATTPPAAPGPSVLGP